MRKIQRILLTLKETTKPQIFYGENYASFYLSFLHVCMSVHYYYHYYVGCSTNVQNAVFFHSPNCNNVFTFNRFGLKERLKRFCP